jgi:hypothetical protein
MGLEISMAAGRLDDLEAIERFLAAMPGAESLRLRLAPAQTAWLEQYEASTSTARYLVADGVRFACFIVAGVSLADARRIAVRTRESQDWSVEGFHATVEGALGVPIVPARRD